MPSVSGVKNSETYLYLHLYAYMHVYCIYVCVCISYVSWPMLSEWRCERPHMVCSSRVIGLSSGKQDGSSTYCREYRQKHTLVLLLWDVILNDIQGWVANDKLLNNDNKKSANKALQYWPVAGLQRTARWRCKWRGGLSPCRNIGWRSGVCQTLGGAAPHVLLPQNTPVVFASRLRGVHQIYP